MSEDAARRFPALMPPGDKMESVYKLNGGTGFGGSFMGNDELELPAKWFAASTSTKSKAGLR